MWARLNGQIIVTGPAILFRHCADVFSLQKRRCYYWGKIQTLVMKSHGQETVEHCTQTPKSSIEPGHPTFKVTALLGDKVPNNVAAIAYYAGLIDAISKMKTTFLLLYFHGKEDQGPPSGYRICWPKQTSKIWPVVTQLLLPPQHSRSFPLLASLWLCSWSVMKYEPVFFLECIYPYSEKGCPPCVSALPMECSPMPCLK